MGLDPHELTPHTRYRQTEFKRASLTDLFFPYFQFEEVALYSALWLLDKAKLFSHNRTSPVEISRTISAMVSWW